MTGDAASGRCTCDRGIIDAARCLSVLNVLKLCRSPPALLIAAAWLPQGISGIALGPLVLLRRSQFDDHALRAHELVHVRQFYRTLGLFPALYLSWPGYRLKSEVEAYRVQILLQTSEAARQRLTERAAALLATRYGLRISTARARRALRRRRCSCDGLHAHTRCRMIGCLESALSER